VDQRLQTVDRSRQLLQMRKAFTLMEILVSVALISLVVAGIVQMQKNNILEAKYIAGRVQEEMSNTIFLSKEALKYNRSEKDAYTIVHNLGIKNDKTKNILKNIKRKIYISEPLKIKKVPIPISIKAIMLKNKYSSRYYRITR